MVLIWDRLPDDFQLIGELAFQFIRNAAENTLDSVIAIFQTIATIVANTSRLLQDIFRNTIESFKQLGRANLEGAQNAADATTRALKNLVLQFGNVPRQVQNNFKKLQASDLLPAVELSEGAKELGKEIGEEFNSGFAEVAENGAEKLVSDIFDRADERARNRNNATSRRGSGGERRTNLDDIADNQVKNANKVESAWDRAFSQINQEATDFGALAGEALEAFANRATDALVELATTGEVSFRDFAEALLSDLTRIIARMLIIQALQAVSGVLGKPQAPVRASRVARTQAGNSVVRFSQVKPSMSARTVRRESDSVEPESSSRTRVTRNKSLPR